MPLSMIALITSVMLAALALVVVAAHGAARLSPAIQSRLAVAVFLVYGLVLFLRPSGWALIDVTVLTAAAAGALLLARWLPNATSVIVFLGVAAVVDVVSVAGGPTSAIVEQYREGQSDLLLYLTVLIPLEGRIVPIVGVGDLVVGGAAAIALLRHNYRTGPVLGAVALGLVFALGYALWGGGTAAAIPWMATTVALLVWWAPIQPTNTSPNEGNRIR